MRIQILRPVNLIGVEVGQTHTVYGLSFSGDNEFIIASDVGSRLPQFVPASKACLADARVSRHWVFAPSGEYSRPQSILTVSDWATTPLFFDQLVNGEAGTWHIWHAWLDKMDFEFAEPGLPKARFLEDDWWMCSSCDEAFEHPEPRDETARCPACWTKQATILKPES